MAERVVIGMTGATGQRYGVTALRMLEATDYEVHLVVSDAAEINLTQETNLQVGDVTVLADVVYSNDNIGAEIASGSFSTEGMLVVPCSMKTLSNVATGNAGDLITRTADVTLKERRPLVLMPRETPVNRIHLENMLAVTDAGGMVFPPFPSFYQNPDSIEEMVTHTMARALSHVGVEVDHEEWDGLS